VSPFDGQVIYMTDVDQTAVWDGATWTVLAPIAGGRNLIINGAMQVAQRGTSVASLNTDSYPTADRWYSQIGTLGTWTNSVENDAPTGSGFRKSWKWLCATADASPSANDYMVPQTRLEGQNLQAILKGTSSAKQLTLSFWVKSNVTGTYIAGLFDADNARIVSASYTVSASATWEKKTITFPADTTGAFDNDENRSLDINFWLVAGTGFSSGTLATTWQTNTSANRAVGQVNLAAATSNYWQVTGIQLETGAVATPFEFENIGTTLDKCFRYYQRFVDPAAIGVSTGGGTVARTLFPLYTKMRAAPTSTLSGTLNYYNGAATATGTAISNAFNSVSQGQLDLNVTIGSAGQAISVYTNGGSQYVDFSAEL
jgi:hypothetical protein